jgi:hypothetical protein
VKKEVRYYFERAKARTEVAGRYVLDYLQKHPCVDCGERDVVVLDFDHVRGKKVATISRLIKNGNIKDIKLEIAKCVVRCSNDHHRKTYGNKGKYARMVGIGRSSKR